MHHFFSLSQFSGLSLEVFKRNRENRAIKSNKENCITRKVFPREFTIAIHFFTPVNDKRREAREGERQINPSITFFFFSFIMLAFFIFNFFITYNAERGREVKRQRL